MARRLVLRKETLTVLNDAQLGDVAGAASALCVYVITDACITPVSGLQCLSARLCN